MRIFAALDLPAYLLDELGALQQGLPVGRPSSRDTLHLTLAFAAEQPRERVLALHEELETLRASSFEVQLSGVGSFGRNHPSVLFVDVERNKPLATLRAKVRSAMHRVGVPLQRGEFHPHVTIARFRRGLSNTEHRRLAAFIADHAGFRPPPFVVTSFSLYQSVLHPQGARHEELAHYPLTDSPFPCN